MISGFQALYLAVAPVVSKYRGVGGTVASESVMRSAGILLSRVRAPPPAPWPKGGLESLRPHCCGLAIYKSVFSAVAEANLVTQIIRLTYRWPKHNNCDTKSVPSAITSRVASSVGFS
ncbi:hypothetical protein PoB_003440500 [Plakobranchus ocellatus]|uniref:Uncharacterized protein n=1 Tax=Plakobranchus ocellatus TaxID=259542 RepID=A0AAV4AIA0_9GAST|nr:hypothetical protein PoB_003440500 [Plakobranchus ocellatus]